MKSKLIKLLKNKEVILYLVFGALTTLVSLGSYFLLKNTFFDVNNSIELQIVNIISWILAVTFAYVTNRKYVFESKSENVIKEAFKFYLARVSSLLIDILLMFIFVSLLNFNDSIIKLLNQGIIIVVNYVFSKLLIFKKDDSNEKNS